MEYLQMTSIFIQSKLEEKYPCFQKKTFCGILKTTTYAHSLVELEGQYRKMGYYYDMHQRQFEKAKLLTKQYFSKVELICFKNGNK
jgi:hypothetical protein